MTALPTAAGPAENDVPVARWAVGLAGAGRHLASPRLPVVQDLSAVVVASVTALGALGTGVAFVIHLRNIRLIGASAASMVTYVVPVFATVIGIGVLGETVSWNEPVGALVVLLGVAVSQGAFRLGGTGPADRVRRRRIAASSVAERPAVAGRMEDGE